MKPAAPNPHPEHMFNILWAPSAETQLRVRERGREGAVKWKQGQRERARGGGGEEEEEEEEEEAALLRADVGVLLLADLDACGCRNRAAPQTLCGISLQNGMRPGLEARTRAGLLRSSFPGDADEGCSTPPLTTACVASNSDWQGKGPHPGYDLPVSVCMRVHVLA
ncbi:hypothetical protein D4764_01G0001430 [Takifugu flavidus]|uniref:Uncharacterized protein n=1 Tax=Takifugu flavidus TaxID=433684 RepID=A0A5C6PNK9_9TELE|nr:hypothetical protein D4764_01G0001430 [Takifugu flavidus]